jgi:hypothetical protein
MRGLIVGVCLLSCFAVIGTASQADKSFQPAPKVVWQGDRPTCPAGYQPAASEEEYRTGQGDAHCVQ